MDTSCRFSPQGRREDGATKRPIHVSSAGFWQADGAKTPPSALCLGGDGGQNICDEVFYPSDEVFDMIHEVLTHTAEVLTEASQVFAGTDGGPRASDAGASAIDAAWTGIDEVFTDAGLALTGAGHVQNLCEDVFDPIVDVLTCSAEVPSAIDGGQTYIDEALKGSDDGPSEDVPSLAAIGDVLSAIDAGLSLIVVVPTQAGYAKNLIDDVFHLIGHFFTFPADVWELVNGIQKRE
jgi:hypothetical protein